MKVLDRVAGKGTAAALSLKQSCTTSEVVAPPLHARDEADRIAKDAQENLRSDIEKLEAARKQLQDDVAAMQQYVEAQGCVLRENRGMLFGGHAIGLENYQRPNLAPAAAQPEFQNAQGQVLFEPGMMFTYEMPIQLPGSTAFFNVEDDVVVTATGVENMSATVHATPPSRP